MKAVEIGKLIVENNSHTITSDELSKCIKLLPIEYRNVESKVFIHENCREYFHLCIKNMRLLDLIGTMEEKVFEKIKRDSIIEGIYKRNKNEIHIFEDKIRNSILVKKKQFEKLDEWQYVNNDIWKKYENMWTKYKIIYDLIHEMTHAIQFSKNKFTISFKDMIRKWDDKKYEIDAVRRSEAIYKKLDKNFIEILKAEGIHVYHQYENELYIGFKYNIKYKRTD
ncbi:hypothetical protein ACJDU8_02340 [Clostridium sp. WILCCON 0269]|uniref:Uncharacterized protein n=1 Tax=Candidatus Clostridium eludens TaxID=3381663 RepID=A0ABW8SGG0_9CLOT